MITVVGAGFAGVEAAWTIAERGLDVTLVEMRPAKSTPAHTTGFFAELVCSNSLKSALPTSPAGQLKAEMEGLGSLVLQVAYRHRVPAGQALGVDRDAFGEEITRLVREHPRITVEEREFTPADAERALEAGWLVLATGPLTTDPLSEWLAAATGRSHLHFYDAVSPTVDASTIDRTIAFAQSRYDKQEDAGAEGDYLNCPFEKDEYLAFVHALRSAERVPLHAFEAGGNRNADGSGPLPTMADDGREAIDGNSPPSTAPFLQKVKYFAGCTPIEAIADGGERSLAFGNFKPVGLTDPRTGRRPYAALQLRPENKEKTLYSLVACQNRLRFGEQKRVFSMVPGLANAEFVRYGVIHRNTYIEAPRVLTPTLRMKDRPRLIVAGQLTGVEGYVESAAMGIYAGLVVAAGGEIPLPPRETAYGGLIAHLMDDTPREFAPMNVNWGLFPDPEGVPPKAKDVKRERKIENARRAFGEWHSRLVG